MAKHVVLLTQNPKKVEEWEKRLSLYGIKVWVEPWSDDEDVPGDILSGYKGHPKCIAVLRESSNLYDPGSSDPVEPPYRNLQVVDNVALLQVFSESPSHSAYEAKIEGYVDSSRAEDSEVFGWDDVFVAKNTQQTYQEMKHKGLKLSARDQVISAFLKDHVWYSKQVNLKWQPQDVKESVDFDLNPVSFVESHPYYGPLDGTPRSILDGALASGLFLRSAKNRREKNYWLPGLNAGIPLTPKSDEFHEATFMMHDFGHFVFPDLIVDGDSSWPAKQVYVTHRMMSEAFTLVLADMLFVDFWKQKGLSYDFSKRRIYPLFEEASGAGVEELLRANARYCLMGDRSGYKALGVSDATLEHFATKYEQFFVSDYRWTAHNFDHMVASRLNVFPWLAKLGSLDQDLGVPFQTVSGYINRIKGSWTGTLDQETLFELVFNTYLEDFKAMISQRKPQDLSDVCARKGFARYMIGQCAIFSKYDIPESETYRRNIYAALRQNPDAEDRKAIRGYFNQYLSILADRGYITQSDKLTFEQVYPLFDPYYVSYDTKSGETIAEVSAKIMKGTL